LEDLEHLKKKFTDYVAGFYTENTQDNRAIRLKEEHTKRVCQNIVMLGKALNMSGHDIMLAETMALFHDIGRFKQYKLYGTFNDMASENHATLGLRQVALQRYLSCFTKPEKRLISRAIAYHNAAALPENEDKRTLFFMRLLRDADKLDVWRVVTDYYRVREKQPNPVIELGLPDDPVCSQKAIKALHEHRFVSMQDLKTLNDFKLLLVSWVFDLNFVPSFQEAQNRNYIGQIEKALPQSKEVTEAVKQARDYIEEAVKRIPLKLISI